MFRKIVKALGFEPVDYPERPLCPLEKAHGRRGSALMVAVFLLDFLDSIEHAIATEELFDRFANFKSASFPDPASRMQPSGERPYNHR